MKAWGAEDTALRWYVLFEMGSGFPYVFWYDWESTFMSSAFFINLDPK